MAAGPEVAAVWSRLAELGVRHRAVRAVQRQVVEDGAPRDGAGARVDLFGQVEDPDRYVDLPLVLAAREGNAATRSLIQGAGVAVPSIPWLDDDPAAALRWLIASGARVWVPTAGRLAAHDREVRRRIGDAPVLAEKGKEMISEAWRQSPWAQGS